LDDLEETVWYMEHPFSSFAHVAHRKAIGRGRDQGLIVMLTGQGSDEQLGGYGKFLYFYLQDRLRRGRLSGPLSMVIGCIREGTVLPEFRLANARRYIPFLRARFARKWVGSALAGASLLDTGLGASYEEREWRDLRLLSLPALLLSEDRMSMSHSVEMRTPFLDYRLVEALGQVPPEKKLVRGWTKHILREAVKDLLPPEITWRKDKKGYSLPGDVWMRGALRSRVAEVLEQTMMCAELGFVNAPGARALFDDLLANRPGVQHYDVLRIVTLEFWLRRFGPYIDTGVLA
jgi:asparagine synthase (glutamine-hydrolysing)